MTSASKVQWQLLALPDQVLQESTADRKLNIGFVIDPKATQDFVCYWSQILAAEALKSNPQVDGHSKTWLEIVRYNRKALAA